MVSLVTAILSFLLICLWVNEITIKIWHLETRGLIFLFILSSVLSFLLHKKQRVRAVRELEAGSEKILDQSKKEAETLRRFLNARDSENYRKFYSAPISSTIVLNFQFKKFVSYRNIVLHSLHPTFVSLKYEFSRGEDGCCGC